MILIAKAPAEKQLYMPMTPIHMPVQFRFTFTTLYPISNERNMLLCTDEKPAVDDVPTPRRALGGRRKTPLLKNAPRKGIDILSQMMPYARPMTPTMQNTQFSPKPCTCMSRKTSPRNESGRPPCSFNPRRMPGGICCCCPRRHCRYPMPCRRPCCRLTSDSKPRM